MLQEREFERLGGTETIKVNVRLIAATNQDLRRRSPSGTFREDLYYRLNVFTIFVPPLRERKPDILLLADHFLEKYARRARQEHQADRHAGDRHADELSLAGQRARAGEPIERAVLVCDGQVIHGAPPAADAADRGGFRNGGAVVARAMRSAVREGPDPGCAEEPRGNRAKAARLLGTTERIIGYKIRKYEIEVARFRGGASVATVRRRTGTR